MVPRKLLMGLGAILIVVGLGLAALAPGGFLNRGSSAVLVTPLGTLDVRQERPASAGVITGYVLLAVGACAAIGGFAMK
jgi:hypothetical protein